MEKADEKYDEKANKLLKINKKEVIETLKNGHIHIVEPDLQGAFEEALRSGRLLPTDKLEKSRTFSKKLEKSLLLFRTGK